jgi:putative transposase
MQVGCELILKIEYLAAKPGKVTLKSILNTQAQNARIVVILTNSNRDGEKFICVECGYHEHADIALQNY